MEVIGRLDCVCWPDVFYIGARIRAVDPSDNCVFEAGVDVLRFRTCYLACLTPFGMTTTYLRGLPLLVSTIWFLVIGG